MHCVQEPLPEDTEQGVKGARVLASWLIAVIAVAAALAVALLVAVACILVRRRSTTVEVLGRNSYHTVARARASVVAGRPSVAGPVARATRVTPNMRSSGEGDLVSEGVMADNKAQPVVEGHTLGSSPELPPLLSHNDTLPPLHGVDSHRSNAVLEFSDEADQDETPSAGELE